jgi:hypothetical protein
MWKDIVGGARNLANKLLRSLLVMDSVMVELLLLQSLFFVESSHKMYQYIFFFSYSPKDGWERSRGPAGPDQRGEESRAPA